MKKLICGKLLCVLFLVLSFSTMLFAKNKKIIIGTNATHPPFTYTESNGDITGHDIELLKKILSDAGYDYKIVNMKFEGLIPSVQQKKIDIIACALSVNPERSKKVLFTNSYYIGGTQIAVLKNNNTIKNWEDLRGKRVGVELGTIQAKIAIEEHEVGGYTYTEYDSEDIFNALKTGKIDATISDSAISNFLFNKSKVVNAKLVGKSIGDRGMSFAVNLKNKELADIINVGLEKLKKDGFYKKNYDKFMN